MSPIRTCLACRTTADKSALLRLAVVDGTVSVDPLARRPGRGTYLCPRESCLTEALRRNGTAIGRALRVHGELRIDTDALQDAVTGPRGARDDEHDGDDRTHTIRVKRSAQHLEERST